MKAKIGVLLIILLTLSTGCTTRFTDEQSKKSYTSNILCQPTTEKMKDVYQRNEDVTKIKLEDLSKCRNLKVNENGYEGLWTSIFVKPLAWLIIKVGLGVKNYGFSIIILGVVLRLILMPLSSKSSSMSENMKKAQPELDKLEKKYKDRTDKEATMMKSQEMMMIYKKYNIKPLSGCLVALIQLPIFFAFLEAINRIPVIFEERFIGLDMGITPWEAVTSGKWYYLVLVIIIAVTTYYTFKTTTVSAGNQNQTNLMNKFMIGFIVIASFSFPTAIALYWIATSVLGIAQTYTQKLIAKKKTNKTELIKTKEKPKKEEKGKIKKAKIVKKNK